MPPHCSTSGRVVGASGLGNCEELRLDQVHMRLSSVDGHPVLLGSGIRARPEPHRELFPRVREVSF